MVLGWVLVATAETQLCNDLDLNVQGFQLLRTTLSGISLPRFFTRSRAQLAAGSVKAWNLTPSPHRENTMR